MLLPSVNGSEEVVSERDGSFDDPVYRKFPHSTANNKIRIRIPVRSQVRNGIFFIDDNPFFGD